jgi:hypothetical protein
MTITQLIGIMIFISLILGIGIFLTFFPDRVIKIQAKFQESSLRAMGYDDNAIDNLPFYSSIFGEPYSQRLKTQKENPKKYKYFILWVRFFGVALLTMTCTSSKSFGHLGR